MKRDFAAAKLPKEVQKRDRGRKNIFLCLKERNTNLGTRETPKKC